MSHHHGSKLEDCNLERECMVKLRRDHNYGVGHLMVVEIVIQRDEYQSCKTTRLIHRIGPSVELRLIQLVALLALVALALAIDPD